MKFKQVNDEIKAPFGANLLAMRGITNLEGFMKPTQEFLQDWRDLSNIENGVQLLRSALDEDKRILIVVDCDNDGFASSAITYQYIKKIKPSAHIRHIIHEAKGHGLSDLMPDIIARGPFDLIVIPDAGTNDQQFFAQMPETKFLVLDHHELENKEANSPNAIIINNQTSPAYKNKDLCGTGVTYQFFRAYDEISKTNEAEEYLDLVAWATIADMMNVANLENRYLICAGLAKVNNYFFKTLIEKQAFSMGGKLNPISVAFYIVPLINAMIRVGTMEEKERLFLAFLDGTEMVVSNKRGAKGSMEEVAIESARECTNAKAKQNRIKESVVEKLELKIQKNGLLDNKILFVRLDDDDDFPAVLNGLVAMQLSAKYKRPTIVARLNDEGFVRGSARGLNDSDLRDFKSFLNESGFFEYTAGHANAFGISIPNSRLEAFHKDANDKLKEIDFNDDFFEVSFVRKAADPDIEQIIRELDKYKDVWGQQNQEPLIAVTHINITADDIQVMGKNGDTVKFEKFGITYIRFHAKDLIEDLSKYPEMQIEIVGKANLNEYYGRTTPQIFIEAYNISDGSLAF